ncbi:unnamed protein product [Paramecium sonneborni]|uniref:Uncharacterized protein n=1 Tax=Paramecium sonneborni TaxID=65129 RepID=A0A8S1QJN4_9CILI|nr:unnamed protein product [Paramecium sonneborni]
MEQKEDLFDLLASSKVVDQSMYEATIKLLRKENVSDCLKYLSDQENLSSCLQSIYKAMVKTKVNQEEVAKNQMQIMMNILQKVKDHDFNNKNYCEDLYEEFRKDLIKKIKKIEKIIELLKFLVQLTTLDEQFIQCGSNALYLLVQMKVDLTNKSFEDIRIKNTSLIGANFVKCNLSGSIFENVDISGVNLNSALLLNCKWKYMKINELNKLDGHTRSVHSVCFSPNGTTLASGSWDKSIRLWDVKTGQQKAQLDGQCVGNVICCGLNGISPIYWYDLQVALLLA